MSRLGVFWASLLLTGWAANVRSAEDVPPPPAAEAVTPVPVDAAFHSQLASLLEEGFERQAGAVEAAGSRAESLQKLRPADPRPEYALALVLLRNFRQGEAADHLNAAIAVDRAYLPAWKLWFSLQLKGKHYSEVIERLYELADVVGEANPSPPDAAAREEAARFIGRVVAFLEGPLGDYELSERMGPHARNLDVLLGDQLHAAYTAGRIELTRAHHALLDETKILEAAAEADKQHELDVAQTRSEELDAQKEDVQRTQKEWDAIIQEEVGEIDSKLAALEKRHDAVQQELTSLADAITIVRLEIQRLLSIRDEMIRDGQDRDPPRRVNTTGIDVRISALQVELDQYVVQYDAASQEQAQILQAAGSLMRQRERALSNYQRATGKAADRIRQLDRWTERIEAAASETAQTPASEARAVAALRRRIRNWSSYDDFELSAEKARLLAEYIVVP